MAFVHSHAHGHHHEPLTDVELGTRDGIRAVQVSLVVLLVTALAQAVVVTRTGSVALLADTLHNLVDALTAVPLWIAYAVSRLAPTKSHTFGFGRAEELAGLLIVGAVAVSAGLIGYQSVHRMLDPEPINGPWLVALAGGLGCLGNEAVARYRIRVGRRIGSAALVADGRHARSDALTSLAVVGSALAAGLGAGRVDPLIGLVITGLVLLVLVQTARDVWGRMMDSVDPELTLTAEAALRATPGVRDVEMLRLRWIGHRIEVQARISVDPGLGLVAADEINHACHHALEHALPHVAQSVFEIVPARGVHRITRG